MEWRADLGHRPDAVQPGGHRADRKGDSGSRQRRAEEAISRTPTSTINGRRMTDPTPRSAASRIFVTGAERSTPANRGGSRFHRWSLATGRGASAHPETHRPSARRVLGCVACLGARGCQRCLGGIRRLPDPHLCPCPGRAICPPTPWRPRLGRRDRSCQPPAGRASFGRG